MAEETTLRVITFNMKRDGRLARKKRWQDRRELAASVIRDSGASIVGVQELMPDMRRDLDKLLPEYSLFGWGRRRDLSGEHADIIVKNEDIEVLFHDTFWLSKKPGRQGSRYLLAAFPRICTVAELYLKKTGQRVRVFNTHFDHLLPMSRKIGVHVIFKRIFELQRVDPLPMILMGDLNTRPSSATIAMLRERSRRAGLQFIDVFGLLGESEIGTFHSFKGESKGRDVRFDYIFVTDDFEVIDVSLDRRSQEGRYPSDHYPVISTLKLKNAH